MSSLDYDLGLRRLWVALEGLDDAGERLRRLEEFATIEARFHQNRDESRRFGSDENLRSELARIVDSLNRLALSVVAVSFTDLCRSPRTVGAPVPAPFPADGGSHSGPPRLGRKELDAQGYLQVFAELFQRELEAYSVLADAGLSRSHLAPWGGTTTPLQYWELVFTELDRGIVANGFEALLRAAARRYPYHRLLKPWAPPG